MISNRISVLGSIAGGVLAILMAFVYGSSILAAVAGGFFFMSVLLWKYGYIVFPLITKHTNIVETRGKYEVPPTRDFILMRTPAGYYASKFLEVRFYESSMDKEKREVKTLFESFEKALLSLRHIVKISMLISAIDVSKHLDEI